MQKLSSGNKLGVSKTQGATDMRFTILTEYKGLNKALGVFDSKEEAEQVSQQLRDSTPRMMVWIVETKEQPDVW
tara:strand:- start:295 stop:516 length:222 start_codon:yes stop_codon:yes gene_type:complete